MRHPKSLAVSYKLLIINNSILPQQKNDEVGRQHTTPSSKNRFESIGFPSILNSQTPANASYPHSAVDDTLSEVEFFDKTFMERKAVNFFVTSWDNRNFAKKNYE